MTTSSKGVRITPSVLDRLIDDEPESSWEADPNESWNITMLIESVRQDVEDLLNTRIGTKEYIPLEFEETRKSLAEYGIPDLTSFHLKNKEDQDRLTRLIENAIRTFEPRLQRVKVILKNKNESEEYQNNLRFAIEGMLKMEPSPERVVFDTQLELSSGEYKVQGTK